MFFSSSGLPNWHHPTADGAVEDQRGVGSALADESLLECSIGVVRELLLGVEGVEPRTPATAPHAVVSFREARERVPRLRGQRPNGEGRGGVLGHRPQLKRDRAVPSSGCIAEHWPSRVHCALAP